MTNTSTEVRVDASYVRPNPPNARRTVGALRELGYDSYAAIADISDNSVDAGASTINIEVVERGKDIIIEITDDGCGMDEDTLDEALRLGSDTGRSEDDLGKYGIGLVTASISIARRVEVFTRTEDGTTLFGGFDLDEIQDRNEFVKWIQPYTSTELFPGSGTRVRLTKCDRISNRNPTSFANTLKKRLAQLFRKYLKSSLKIVVNGSVLEPVDPLMLADPKTRLILDEDMEVEGGTIHIRVVDLPDYGLAVNKDLGIIPQNSGFYILRNNREIMEAQTFDFYRKHPDYSHFRAEIEFSGVLDGVMHTDAKKMTITPSQSILDKLRGLTAGLIANSGREGRNRAHIESGGVDHSIAEGNIKRRAQLIPKPRALVETRETKGGKGSHTRGNGDRVRANIHAELKTVTGLRAVFNEADYGDGPFYSVRQEGKTIVVTYNREHPFWRELIEHSTEPKVIATLDYLVFSLANAELLVPEQAQVVKANLNSTLLGLLV